MYISTSVGVNDGPELHKEKFSRDNNYCVHWDRTSSEMCCLLSGERNFEAAVKYILVGKYIVHYSSGKISFVFTPVLIWGAIDKFKYPHFTYKDL